MPGLAKSPKENTTTVVLIPDRKEFLRKFNESRPPEELSRQFTAVGRLFGITGKEEKRQ